MTKSKEKTLISKWLSFHKGVTITYIARKEGVEVSTLYNFTKGLTKSKKSKNIFIKYGVPDDVIEKTLNKIERKEN